jgi:3-oxoacyl-(acyl-carrier-protein) synthase
MKQKRVVITGMGVVAPNGINLSSYNQALRSGLSGIRFAPELEALNLGCQVAGIPDFDENTLAEYFTANTLKNLKSTGIKYACSAALEAWFDAGFTLDKEHTDWNTACVFGNTIPDLDFIDESISKMKRLESRRLGTRVVEQCMSSGVSAYIAGLLGLGNHVYSNSSACATGTDSIIIAYEKIKSGTAKRVLAGSCEATSAFIWATFDAMRVLNRKSNNNPEAASRPMSASAAGFIPASGAGALLLEDMETATARGARIYAEILGGASNSGGQRNKGTMTAPNIKGVQRCISAALKNSKVTAETIDIISGHLTATFADKVEVANWSEVLNLKGKDFPYINSVKSMIGHCLGGAGSIECIAAVLQVYHNYVHPSINTEDIHPEILDMIDISCIPSKRIDKKIKTVIKANFGFGDVNSCIVFSDPKET